MFFRAVIDRLVRQFREEGLHVVGIGTINPGVEKNVLKLLICGSCLGDPALDALAPLCVIVAILGLTFNAAVPMNVASAAPEGLDLSRLVGARIVGAGLLVATKEPLSKQMSR